VAELIPGVAVRVTATVAAETPMTCGVPTEAAVFIATEAATIAAAKIAGLLTKLAEDACAAWATLELDDEIVAEKTTDVSRRDAVDVTEQQPCRHCPGKQLKPNTSS